jgi:hypothetical protein
MARMDGGPRRIYSQRRDSHVGVLVYAQLHVKALATPQTFTGKLRAALFSPEVKPDINLGTYYSSQVIQS